MTSILGGESLSDYSGVNAYSEAAQVLSRNRSVGLKHRAPFSPAENAGTAMMPRSDSLGSLLQLAEPTIAQNARDLSTLREYCIARNRVQVACPRQIAQESARKWRRLSEAQDAFSPAN